MNKKNITLMVVAVLTLITFVGLATYAYFVGNINTTRTSNVTATTERNNLVFDTNGGAMNLNVSAANMQRAKNGTVAAQNSTTLTVNLTANTDYSMVCTYDIIYEWTSSDRYTSHSTGVSSNEFTIKASLANNNNTNEGINGVYEETDLSELAYTSGSTTIVSGAQIDATGSTMSTAVWTLESKIYNVNANQTNLVNKNFGGKFKISNVSCVAGNKSSQSQRFAYWWSNEGYSSGEMPSDTYRLGYQTGHNEYIRSTSEAHYPCVLINGQDFCLSQPYTQYTGGESVDGTLTDEQKNSIERSLTSKMVEFGIPKEDISCQLMELPGVYAIVCIYENYGCYVNNYGYVACGNYDTLSLCAVSVDGYASCDVIEGYDF